MPTYIDRVATKATEVRVVSILLSLIALPFYVLGFVAAVVFVLVRWCVAAVLVGFSDAMSRSGRDDAG